MKNKVLLLTIVLFTTITSTIFANDLSIYGKQLNFYLDSSTGNFYLENPNPKTESLKNLLFKDIPPTSYITLILNKQPYSLTDSAVKVTDLFQIEENIIWGSFTIKDVNFKVSFLLTNTSGKTEKDSLICMISIKNNSKKKVQAGARLLFDTFYDERWGNPYLYMSSTEKIKYEKLLNKATMPDFVFSGKYDISDREFGEGLFIYPYINSIRPDVMIIGNWKKLDENELDYKVDPRAKFKYNDFANKDAAIAIFYNGTDILPNETVNIGSFLTRKSVVISRFFEKKVDVPAVETTIAVVDVPSLVKTVKPTETNIAPTKTNTIQPKPTESVVYTDDYEIMRKQQEINLLKAQIAAMEKLANLIEKIDVLLTNPSALQQQQPITKEVIPTEVSVETIDTNDTGKIVTNKVKTTEDYEKELAEQKLLYEELIKKQEDEFAAISTNYASKLKEAKNIKNKSDKLKSLNTSIEQLDQKIKIIEELEKLKLNFENLPEEKLQKLLAEIDKIEKNLIKQNIYRKDE